MLAVHATAPRPDDPLAAVAVGERPEPDPPAGWVTVDVEAASLNRHDLWTLRGVGIAAERFPMILGCDGAGTVPGPDGTGTPVVIYPVLGDAGVIGDETLDPARTLLSEVHPGTMAERVAVPAGNVVPRPPGMSAAQAATLGTTYLTAYRMLTTRSGLAPGSTVLVQGAAGGVSTALIALARVIGHRVWATSRTAEGRKRAEMLGAHAVFEAGARLPDRADGVFESVGAATWEHSMKAVRPGGVIVCCGATAGANPPADLQRLFFRQISVIGSTMGTLAEFRRLIALCAATGLEPVVDRTYPLADGAAALAALENGSPGKLVLTV